MSRYNTNATVIRYTKGEIIDEIGLFSFKYTISMIHCIPETSIIIQLNNNLPKKVGVHGISRLLLRFQVYNFTIIPKYTMEQGTYTKTVE